MAAVVLGGGGAAAAGSWSELPADLLITILKRLKVVDYIRSGAVCTAWNLLTKSKLCRPAPQIPWLMIPAGNDDGTGGCDRRSLFDMSDNKTHTIYLPELHGRQCIGTSADGRWVVFIRKDMELGMLNIFAREQQLTLPPLATLWDFKGVILDTDGLVDKYRVQLNPRSVVEVTPHRMLQRFYHKAIVFQISSEVEPPVVAFVHGFLGKLSVARAGDAAWKKLEVPLGTTDVVFHGGRLYAVNFRGNVVTFDLCSPSSFTWSDAKPLGSPMSVHYDFHQKYLVPLSDRGDDVIQVWRDVQNVYDHAADEDKGYKTFQVKAFRLDLVKGEWVELKDLRGCTCFLGHNYSIALPAREFPQLRRNCIYFTDDNMESMLRSEDICRSDRDLGVFSFEEGSWGALPLPGAIVNFPSPTWVTLSLG